MEHGGGHEIGSHKILEIAGMQVHLDTLIMTWITMAVLIIAIVGCARNVGIIPSGKQNFLEMLMEPILSQVDAAIGKKGQRIVPIVLTLFLFILCSNWIAILPVPGITAPTADMNTTLALALLVIFLVHAFGLHDKGLKYFGHFFKPTPLFFIFHMLDNFTRPITMAVRLFGNILSHEVLMVVLMVLVPFILPSAILFLGVFIGLIQAAIFTILAITYMAEGLQDEH